MLNAGELPNSTKKSLADAVFSASQDWEVTDSVKAMVFGTASANTCAKGGAATILKRDLVKVN